MVADLIRDAPFGQLVRYITHNRIFKYAEEQDDWTCPCVYSQQKQTSPVDSSSASYTGDNEQTNQPPDLEINPKEQQQVPVKTGSGQSLPLQLKKRDDEIILVDWYSTDDPQNPQNWSTQKKIATTFIICFYTFVVYSGSSVYVTSEQGVSQEFGVSHMQSSLGLVLFVLAYGTGALLFSPMSEIPSLGRNIPYAVTFGLFVIICIPTALIDSFSGLLGLRFLLGFLGSPCLATGGASFQDIYSFLSLPLGLTSWVASAYAGPAIGPVLSVFATQAEGWRWFQWVNFFMAVPSFILLFFLLPETSSSNILLKRAHRLRIRTGKTNIKSQSEIDQSNMSTRSVLWNSLIKPFQITLLDPAVLYTNLYTAFIYGIYYSFFEVFPIVYGQIYGFSESATAVTFTSIVASAFIGIAIYISYIVFYMTPDIKKNGLRVQEHRLIPALFFVCFLPVGLFIFGWTSNSDIHWIVSVIGLVIFGAAAFVMMQCLFMYIPLSYPKYAASLFAANSFLRSAMASGSIIFSQPMYGNLGVGRGVSILGGLSVIGVIGMFVLYFCGAKLRAMSKFADK